MLKADIEALKPSPPGTCLFHLNTTYVFLKDFREILFSSKKLFSKLLPVVLLTSFTIDKSEAPSDRASVPNPLMSNVPQELKALGLLNRFKSMNEFS
jgi:hypothetical protein